MKYPDPIKHKRISMYKSVVRLVGYATIPWNLYVAATMLILAEILGIWEETV
jgi:hypothetical protein